MPVFAYRNGELPLSSRPRIMGILNVTPDSFSDGGLYLSPEAAAARAVQMQQEGADIIDIGAQSTRPGSERLSPEEEWNRLEPALQKVLQVVTVPVSVDTFYPEVAEKALRAGAHILNDVTGGMDNGMVSVAAAYGAGLIMMYGQGDAARREVAIADDLAAVEAFFHKTLKAAGQAGLSPRSVCLDPGIGFAGNWQADLARIAHLSSWTKMFPETALLVGASRKRVIADCMAAEGLEPPPPAERLAGTLALHAIAAFSGAHILRVHDVREAVQAAAVVSGLNRVKEGNHG